MVVLMAAVTTSCKKEEINPDAPIYENIVGNWEQFSTQTVSVDGTIVLPEESYDPQGVTIEFTSDKYYRYSSNQTIINDFDYYWMDDERIAVAGQPWYIDLSSDGNVLTLHTPGMISGQSAHIIKKFNRL